MTGPRPAKSAAELIREVAAADPEAHNAALARGYGRGYGPPHPPRSADEIRAAHRSETCEHHWVSSHQPDFPPEVYWIAQCSQCGIFNGALLAEQVEQLRSQVNEMEAENERLNRRLFPSQGESYANEVERQRVVIDGMKHAVEAALARAEEAEAKIADLTDNGRWRKPQVAAASWEKIVRQAVAWPGWNERFDARGECTGDAVMVDFLIAEHARAEELAAEIERLRADWAELCAQRNGLVDRVLEGERAEAQVRAVEPRAVQETGNHRPDEKRGGCSCGFCAWSVEHVVIMSVRAALAVTPPKDSDTHHYSRGYPISNAEHAWDQAGDPVTPPEDGKR